MPAECHSKLLTQSSLLNIPTKRSRITLRRYSSKLNQTLFSITIMDRTVSVIMKGQTCIAKIEGSLDLEAMIQRLKNIWQLRQTFFIQVTINSFIE